MNNHTNNDQQLSMFDGPLEAQFPVAPAEMGLFTEVITKTTFTENTVTRVTNNTLSLPLIEEVCMHLLIHILIVRKTV